MRVRTLFLGASMALLVVGCGGGGGGGSPASPQDPAANSSADADANTANAASEGLSIGDLLMGLAKYEVSASQSVLAAAGTANRGTCGDFSGAYEVNWADASGDGLPGVGDTISVRFTGCKILQTGSIMNGTVVITVTAQSPGALGLSVDYGTGLSLIDVRDNNPSQVLGHMTIAWSDDGLTRQIAVTSSAQDDLKLTSVNPQESTGRVYTEQVKALTLRNTLSRETARASSRLGFQLISQFHGGTYTVATPVALSSYFNTYPDQGEVTVRSTATGAVATIKPMYKADGSELSYELDTNGDGKTDDSGYAQWSEFTTGVMWWGEVFGWPDTFVFDNTHGYSTTAFEALQSTTSVQANAQFPVLAIQFSRPVDPAHLPTLRWRRQNLDRGDPYFWGAEVVPATVHVQGAYLTVTSQQALQHGLTYQLEAADANGASIPISMHDLSGNTTMSGFSELTVDKSLIANTSLPQDAPLLTVGKSITISSAASQSDNGLVSFKWTQVAGPALVFGPTDQASVTVSLAEAPTADTTATVQLQVTDAKGQVEYTRRVISIVATPSDSVTLYVRSQAGDRIGRGQQFVEMLTSSNSGFYVGYPPPYIYFMGNGSRSWNLILYNGQNVPIQVGAYEDAHRLPPTGTGNGIDFSYWGQGCNRTSGRFQVLEVAYDFSGQVTKLAVDFDQSCDGATAGLFGSFRYHSAIPVRP